MSKAQEELQAMFKMFASGFDDERLEKFIVDLERIMRGPGGQLLAQAGLAGTTEPFTLLDHGCGTGPIAAQLYETVDEKVLGQSKMVCADLSDTLVGTLKRRAEKNGWSSVETKVLDAQKSGFGEETFSHITINFAMHIVPDPDAVLKDAMRILKPGGVFAFTVWHKDNLGWVPDMRSAFEALPFDAPVPAKFPMAPNGRTEFIDPELIPAQLTKYGFEDVKVQTIDHIMHIESAEDYLQSFGMMREWMTKTWWSEESQEKAKGMLDEHIEKHLREKHDGKGWDLTWTFIQTTCRKPAN